MARTQSLAIRASIAWQGRMPSVVMGARHSSKPASLARSRQSRAALTYQGLAPSMPAFLARRLIVAEDPRDWELETQAVRGGMARSPYGEIAEAMYLTQSFAYPD